MKFNDDQEVSIQVEIIKASNNTASVIMLNSRHCCVKKAYIKRSQKFKWTKVVKPEDGEIVASLVPFSASFILQVIMLSSEIRI